jgi:hypothetical protein
MGGVTEVRDRGERGRGSYRGGGEMRGRGGRERICQREREREGRENIYIQALLGKEKKISSSNAHWKHSVSYHTILIPYHTTSYLYHPIPDGDIDIDEGV